jgi:uncharacterized protein (TIRG00374 family)
MIFKVNKKITLVLQYLAAAAIIGFILWRIDPSKIGGAMGKIAWWTIPVIVTSSLASMLIQGIRWWLLVRAFSKEITLKRALSYHFSSIFYSMVLPTSAAQEVVRTLFIVKTAGTAVSWGAAWICKITAVSISMLFSVYGLLYISRSDLPAGTEAGIGIFCFLLLAAGVVSFSKRVTAPLRKASSAVIPEGLMKKIEHIREGIYQYRTKKKELLLTILLTTLIQIIFVLNLAFTIKGVSGAFFFWQCLAFMPLIEIISMSQPFTPNGMGVREALTALMFKHLGLTGEQLGIYIVLILASNLLKLVGAIPVFYGMTKKRGISATVPME